MRDSRLYMYSAGHTRRSCGIIQACRPTIEGLVIRCNVQFFTSVSVLLKFIVEFEKFITSLDRINSFN